MARRNQQGRGASGRALVIGSLAVATVLGAVACSSDEPAGQTPVVGSLPDTTTAGSTPPGNEVSGESTCVTDPEAVVARQPTPEMTDAELPADLVADLDAAARSSFTEAAAPGAVVGVRTPEGTWTAAYGEADPDAGTPMEVGMHTRIGSVTKTFTGTMVMQLAEQGRLSLDDPISMYVPDVPNGDEITLRMLANMTSGVASYTRSTDFTDIYFAEPETIFTPDELLAVGLAQSPLFDPGTEYDYSNTNTVLLGMVIEQVTGQDVRDVFEELILEPLALTDTSWPGESTEIPEPYAQGFTLQGDFATPDDPSNATNWNPAWGWTAGEMISNMDDLLTYGRALGTGQGLLEPETQVERLTSFPGEAGYGIAMGCIGGWVGHNGELPGYNTSVFYDTANDTTVIVQVNSDIASGDCAESPTLTDDPGTEVCSSPATRMLVAVTAALGNEFQAAPQK